MLSRRTDLPLGRDTTSRVVPWIIALMAYLAALALAGTLLLNAFAARWDSALAATLTVQVPSLEAADPEAGLQAALQVLERTPGVLSARKLERDEIAALVEPWLGPGGHGAELPLPGLIDVTLEAAGEVDLDALRERLREAAPGAVIEDHGLWRRQLVGLARSIGIITLTVVALIAVSAVLVVVFATQAALSTHREVIEVLHLVGAHDDYVARQFQAHMLRRGLAGGIGGVALAVLTLHGFAYAAQGVDATLLPHLALGLRGWATLAALPVVVALIARYTARFTVLRILGRLP
jgi:cell division transport system permease protein